MTLLSAPAWELWFKPHSERRPAPNGGTYIGWDDGANTVRRYHFTFYMAVRMQNVSNNEVSNSRYNSIHKTKLQLLCKSFGKKPWIPGSPLKFVGKSKEPNFFPKQFVTID